MVRSVAQQRVSNHEARSNDLPILRDAAPSRAKTRVNALFGRLLRMRSRARTDALPDAGEAAGYLISA